MVKKQGLIPQSIRGRLLLAAIVFSGLALLLASLSVGNVFERFARRGLNDRLDAQIALLSDAVRPDGKLDRARITQIGPFTQHDGGWGWIVRATDASFHSDEITYRAPVRSEGHHHDRPRPSGPPPWARDDDDDEEERGQTRTLDIQTPTGTVSISAWAPEHVVERMRSAAIMPWAISLGALAAFLAVATILQLRVGLHPLARVKVALRAVRDGSSSRIPEDQPLELRELVHELNGLLDENEAALGRARGHVANLAHSLKTPLATLELKLREGGRDPGGELAALVAQVDGAIRHHLGRARAASPGAPGQLKVELRPALAELMDALGRIHAERGIVTDNGVPPGTTCKCEPQDLDEMLGNLLDNAWKWAKGRISVTAVEDGALLRIRIDDDGPGLSEEAMEQALVRGQRLDEREDGHGFGLPIARELAELHGGALDLGPSPMGGLRAMLTLPR